MDPTLYKAAISGNINVLKAKKEKLEVEMTINNNTVLHLASQLGHADCVMEIIDLHPSLLNKPNSRYETPLHLAAQNGHASVCLKLIEFAKKAVPAETRDIESGVGAVKEMLWIQNKEKDTALHLASRHNFHEVVGLLIKEDPSHPHPTNDADETPLYLASIRGHSLVVDEILLHCVSPAYTGPQGTTALHGAVISRDTESVGRLLEWDRSLIRKTNEAGRTPLHYGALLGCTEIVKQLLLADKSSAYIQDRDSSACIQDGDGRSTGRNTGRNTALHLAASRGRIAVMKEIVSLCPDSWDMVNGGQQRNIMHIAMAQGHKKMVEFILEECPVISSVLNQKDVDGNTPFHLMANSFCFVPKLINHTLLDKGALNNKNLTALDLVASADHPPEIAVRQREIVRELKHAGATSSFHNSIINNQDEENTIADELNPSRGRNKEIAQKIAMLRKMADTHMIVAALVATVTFAAGFTMPGGYQGNKGQDQGLAILRKVTAFNVFALADTLALGFSLFAICIYFTSASHDRLNKLAYLYEFAGFFVQLSILAMLIAFLAGTYATLAPLKLAIATCVFGSILAYFANVPHVLISIPRLPWTLAFQEMVDEYNDRFIQLKSAIFFFIRRWNPIKRS